MRNSVKVIRTASEYTMEITEKGHITRVDLSKRSAGKVARLMWSMMQWVRGGYKGYPVF